MTEKSLFSNMYPNPFPPTWAETWGEDECGLYADLRFSPDISPKNENIFLKTINRFKQNEEIVNISSVTQRFRWIAAGDFLMGSPENEVDRDDDEEQHKVTLTQGYWLADTATTQAFWSAIMGSNPANFKSDKNNPVERVSWNDCQNFIGKLNTAFSGHLDGLSFRLPSEAEWEHVCRAGTTTPFYFGESISSEKVNFDGSMPYNNGPKSEDRNKTVAVKSLPANQWGLYEMHGNVWELCADARNNSMGSQSVVDPCHGGGDDAYRVRRGGSWAYDGRLVRSAYRIYYLPADRDAYIGFRLSLGHELKARSAKK